MSKKKVEVSKVTEPEVTTTEVEVPKVIEPETPPEVTEPEVTEPEVTEPEVTEPEVTEPEVTEPEVKPESPKAQPPKRKPAAHHKAFFGQYIDLMRTGRPTQGIKALSNCIKTVLSGDDEILFRDLVKMFRSEKSFLIPARVLQSAATVSSAERAKLEIIVTLMSVLINRPHSPVNLDTARAVLKNDAFVDFIAKQIAMAK